MLARTSAVVLLGAVVGVGLIRPGVPSPEPTVTQFLLAWESKQYLAAADLTTGQPRAVAAALANAYKHLDASNLDLAMATISQQGKKASATFRASIDLGGSGLTWAYRGGLSLEDGRNGWRVLWSPSVIVPGMTSREQLAVVSNLYPRAQLLDSAGGPLTVKSLAYEVGVYPEQVTNPARTAAMLGAATQILPGQIEGQIESALSDKFEDLMTLSPASYQALAGKLKIPGVIVRPEEIRLFDSIAPDVVGQVGTEVASVLRMDGVQYRPGTTVGLSGLQQTFQRQLIGTPGTEVVLQGQGKPWVALKTWNGTKGAPVRTTLNSSVQRAADSALASVPGSAAIVAVQASTGHILAVASDTGSGMPSLDPLAGQYQPGQAFTLVSSAAILSKGMKLSAPVPCYQRNGTFANDPPEQFVGSTATFEKDFTYGCSTAFAGLSQWLTPGVLASAASSFGIGGWSLPVSSYYAGTLGQPVAGSTLGADMTGAGNVRVSPVDMALAAAVVDSGSWHDPSLVSGDADPSSTVRAAESPQVLSQLRELMQEAAAHGQNQVADVDDDVYAQSGNAAYTTGNLRLSWFVGYQGDVAFAVVQLGKSASASAAPLAGTFLRDIQGGS
jgi:cell division protein FtsI/penicillin-binding protein 2